MIRAPKQGTSGPQEGLPNVDGFGKAVVEAGEVDLDRRATYPSPTTSLNGVAVESGANRDQAAA